MAQSEYHEPITAAEQTQLTKTHPMGRNVYFLYPQNEMTQKIFLGVFPQSLKQDFTLRKFRHTRILKIVNCHRQLSRLQTSFFSKELNTKGISVKKKNRCKNLPYKNRFVSFWERSLIIQIDQLNIVRNQIKLSL